MSKLKKGDITIKEMLDLSRALYKTDRIDNKLRREKMDILGGKIIQRRGLEYNRTTKQWEQTSREVRFDFIVKSDPVSYEKKDTVPIHSYPVTFLLKDFTLGFNSPFKWRTGGLKRWKNSKPFGKKVSDGKTEKEKQRIREAKEAHSKKNLQILNTNIKNGLQGHFIFHLMWVLRQYDLLFGPLTCKNNPPKITNSKLEPYFDKTALYIVLRVLPKIFNNPKLGQVFRR